MRKKGKLKAVVTIILMIALMAFSAGDSAGTVPGMDTDLGDSDASFWGEDARDYSGWPVASAGDVNGDGYDDILISAYGDDDGGSEAGQIYLILGRASGWSMDTDLSEADASFWGENPNDFSGSSVAGVGDVNGDGYDDILIGAFRNSDGGGWAGQTYLILGKPTGWSMDTDLSNADASFWGEDAGDCSGRVAGAGDVNGDGYDDILIGSYYNDDGGDGAGQTYLILGKESGWSMDTDLSNSDASFWGEDAGDCSGVSVAGASDVNGDEYDDILIGSIYNDDGGDGAGQTYLILGKSSGWTMDTSLSNADASFWGENEGDESGRVAGAGDINGDGYDDILIGALFNDDGGIRAGQTYLILGKSSGWSMDNDLSNADASFWGENEGDESGWVAGAGDVNGDGYDDILIGARYNDKGGSNAGQTYLFLGKEEGWSMDTDLSNADASFLGEGAGDISGSSVAGAGDVNGDGYDDILISAQGDGDGGYYAGQTYLVFFEQIDTDKDGVHDDKDAFPDDPTEWNDTDSDGHGDNGDMFPNDPLEWADADYDGYGDNSDVFPGDPLEWLDTDGDGHGDNGDMFPNDPLEWADVDYDGYGDNSDAFPEDPYEWADTDGDGHGDNGDVFPDDVKEWADTDGDGVGDNGDPFPADPLEWLDTDGDGHGDNGDVFPDDPLEWVDGDGDGYGDNGDAFPEDPLEWLDTDGDGYGNNNDVFPDDPLEWTDADGDSHGDNGDAFPDDPSEWLDEDEDGHGDNIDIFPNDPLEWIDADGDGHGDNGDAFPDNPFEWLDTDGDGHGDNGDAFPDDPLEWNDADDDGHGDNGDAFPTDKDEWVDTDGDGSGDNGDAFPEDVAASVDTDGDGYPDEWNTGKSKEDSTTGLKIDQFPDDPEEWKKEDESPSLGLVGALMAILVAALVAYNRRMHRC